LLCAGIAVPEHHNSKPLVVRTVNDCWSGLISRGSLLKAAAVHSCCLVRARCLGDRYVVLCLATGDDVAVISGADCLDSGLLLSNAKRALPHTGAALAEINIVLDDVRTASLLAQPANARAIVKMKISFKTPP
jgi:hypothetical protein